MQVQKPELVNALAVCLSDAVVLSLKVQGAHWNVMGPDFAQYHKFFQKIYEDLYSAIDPLAEDMRKLGSIVPSRLFEFARLTSVEDKEVGCMCLDLSADILVGIEAALQNLTKAFATADMLSEQGIANLIAERIDMHQKWQWQLTSTLTPVTEGI